MAQRNNQMGGGLEPLQQTIFETGPQAGFTPPEVANVYQEGQVQFAQQQIGIEAANIDWYTLGQNASQLAAQTYENVLDYLITSKRNGVVELKDKYQSSLDDFYLKQSTEIYNAEKEKRPPNSKVINDLVTEITKTKESFKDEAIKVLGSANYFAEDLDITSLGLKYQELALTSRSSLRDIDKFANKLLYETQRVINGAVKEEEGYAAWKNGAGVRDPKIQPQVFLGAFPLPAHPENPNLPIIGFEKDMSGNWSQLTISDPMTGEVNSPVVKREDGKWYFQPQYIDALQSPDDFKKLVDIDNFSYGPYSAVMNSSGQFTLDMERMIKDVVETEQPNNGMAAYVATALANVPDHLSENAIDRIEGLDEGQKIKLSMMRMHIKNGFELTQLPQITGLNREMLKGTWGRIQKLRSGATLYNVAENPTEVAKYEELTTVLNGIAAEFNLGLEEDALSFTTTGQNLVDETPEMSASALLTQNPALIPMVARITAIMDANENLYRDNPDRKNADMTQLLKEHIKREGYLVLPNEATGIPNVIYTPNLMYFSGARERLLSAPKLAGLPEEKRERLTSNDKAIATKEQNKALVGAHLFSTNWTGNVTGENLEDVSLRFARQISPKLDTEVFTALVNGAIYTKRGERGERIRSQIPLVELMRLVIASTPTAMEKRGMAPSISDVTRPSFDERLAYAKIVYDDLPVMTEQGAAPWLQADLDVTQQNYNFIGTPRGGLPIKFNEIKGVSGTDYKDVMTVRGSRELGAITPRTADGMPLIFIPSQTDRSGDVSKEFNSGLDRYLEAEAGDYDISPVSYDVETVPNTGTMTPPQVFNQVNESYLPARAVIFTTINEPLSSFERALTFFTQNNVAFHDIVKSDPQLADVQELAWEVAITPDGKQIYDKNKALFTEENLRILYDKAVANGAKTQVDFMGYIFNAMKVYGENKELVSGRQSSLEFITKSTAEDFLGKEGNKKGIILYEPSSTAFYNGVFDRLNQGLNLYKKDGNYYMFTPDQATKDFTMVIDSSKPQEVVESEIGKFKAKQDRVEKAKKSFFVGKKMPSSNGIAELSRPSTIPAEQLESFHKDFMKYSYDTDLKSFNDFRFIDWGKIYLEHNSFPFKPAEIPEQYFLPGHSKLKEKTTFDTIINALSISNMDMDVWPATERSSPEAWAKNQASKSWLNKEYSITDLVDNVRRWWQSSGIETKKQFKSVYPELETILNKTMSEQELLKYAPQFEQLLKSATDPRMSMRQVLLGNYPDAITMYRQESIRQDPTKWFPKIFGNDDTALLRRTKIPANDSITIPEKAFNLVNFVKATDDSYNPSTANGLTQKSWDKIKSSKFTPLELEYQIRVLASTEFKDKSEMEQLNAALETISDDQFVMDSFKTNQFADELHQAIISAQETITKEEAMAIAKDPNALAMIKRNFFALTLKPDGYFTRPGKNAVSTRVSMIADMLRETNNNNKRPDGTNKGTGWLGKQKNMRGETVTEYSIGVEIDGKEVLIPTLVPDLTSSEVQAVLDSSATGKELPATVIKKAVDNAIKRMAKGKSPFKD